MASEQAAADYRRPLEGGLVLRWSTAADEERLAELMSAVFRGPDEPPSRRAADGVRRSMRGETGLMGPGDFALVEDTSRPGSRVVACACLLGQRWAYEGVPFAIGRPESVGTDPGYRNHGLMRAIFDLLHARSAARGDLVQAITGIPYFYRQFGYEYALDLGGGRVTYLSLIPRGQGGGPEPYTLRPATVADLPTIIALCQRRANMGAVQALVPESQFRQIVELWQGLEATGADVTDLDVPGRFMVIVAADGAARGCTFLAERRRGPDLCIDALEMDPEVSLAAAMPSLLRAFEAYGRRIPAKPGSEPFSEICFRLGRTHPVYDALGHALAPVHRPPYAWYLRVPDLVAFLRHIAPTLERRLAGSVAAGHTGDVRINLYRSGLRLSFESGRLTAVEPWQAVPRGAAAEAALPPLVFLQLLFGYRSLDDLRATYPDVWATPQGEPLIQALFPARPSWVVG